jgi:hypothetical protein
MRAVVGCRSMLVALRFLSLILIVVALMLLGADVLTSLEKGGVITVRSIDQVWMIIDKAGDASFKAWLVKTMPGFLVGAFNTVIALPGWAVSGVIGTILAFLFGRRVADVE